MKGREALFQFLCGALFAWGLGFSGMLFPEKILAFLNVTSSQWDPSLLFVMGGAVTAFAAVFRLARRRKRSVLGKPMNVPPRRHVDTSLVVGSALFGIGWGLSGLCPGPAIAALGSLSGAALFFVAAMVAGGLLAGKFKSR